MGIMVVTVLSGLYAKQFIGSMGATYDRTHTLQLEMGGVGQNMEL